MTHVVKKYELVPKRKEMISNCMFHHIAPLYKHVSRDSFIHAVINWIILGCYTGFRKSEWCSDPPDTFDTVDNPN